MSTIKALGLVYRADKPEVIQLAKSVVQWAKSNGIQTWTTKELALEGTEVLKPSALDDIHMMVSLGGDGTYLRAVHLLNGRRTPVLGANLGHTGFLAETKAQDLITVLDEVKAGRAVQRRRAMLEIKVKRKGLDQADLIALNEAVIERGAAQHLIDISVFFGKTLLSRFRADGLIVATPTGTTAYNLSAGGPIVHPEAPVVVITPICPHSLSDRSITLPDSGTITIKLNHSNQKAALAADGRPGPELSVDHEVVIQRSKQEHIMLTSQRFDYFEQLNQKLQFGKR